MRPIQERTDQFTNMSGRRREMAFDSTAVKFLKSTLTEMYSNVKETIVREYLTNALDSHVEAGVETPVDVSFSRIDKKLIIEDYGVGLSESELFDVYALYGSSTKRERDDVAGMLGLGSKSALAYTDAFTVQGTKDGVRTVVLISKNEAGVGEMSVVSSTKSDAPNGVKVVIPCRDDLTDTIQKLLSFLESGKVRFNGTLNKRTFNDADYVEIADGIYVLDTYDYAGNGSYVIMGNVPYPCTIGYRSGIAIDVEIGLVEPTPSREALKGSRHTERGLEEIKLRVNKAREDYERRLRGTSDWDKKFELMKVLQRFGAPVDLDIPAPRFSYTAGGSVTRLAKSGGNITYYYDLQQVQNAVIIKYDLASTPSTSIRGKVRKYLEDNDIDSKQVLFYGSKGLTGGLKHFPKERILDYEDDIKPIKSAGSAGTYAVAGSYSTHNVSLRDLVEVDEEDVDQYKLVYFSRTEDDIYDYVREVQSNPIVKEYFEEQGYRFCILGKNRWDKMNRLGGDDNMHVTDFVEHAIKHNTPKIDKAERERYIMGMAAKNMSYNDVYSFITTNMASHEWPDEVLKIRNYIESFKELEGKLDEKTKTVYGNTQSEVDTSTVSQLYNTLRKQYPLMKVYNSWAHRDSINEWKHYVALVNSQSTP